MGYFEDDVTLVAACALLGRHVVIMQLDDQDLPASCWFLAQSVLEIVLPGGSTENHVPLLIGYRDGKWLMLNVCDFLAHTGTLVPPDSENTIAHCGADALSGVSLNLSTSGSRVPLCRL